MKKINFEGRAKDIINMMQYDDYLLSEVDKVWDILGQDYLDIMDSISFNDGMQGCTGFFIFNRSKDFSQKELHMYHNIDAMDNPYFAIVKLKRYIMNECNNMEKFIGLSSHVNDVIKCQFYPQKIEEVHLLQRPDLDTAF